MNEYIWVRHLSCGHERTTHILAYAGIFTEPKIGEDCYCRICCDNTTVIKVTKFKELKKVAK